MKKSILLLTILFAAIVASFAQTSPTFLYQAVVRNASNRLVQDSTFLVEIQILQGTTAKYREERTITTDHNGMVSFYVGSATGRTSFTGSIESVTNWSEASFKQTFHLGSGDLVVTDPVSPVPYALHTANAASLNQDNSFTGKNHFNDTVTVPSGFDFSTTSTTCRDVAVNACDLLTVFDSIQRQFAAMQTRMDAIQDTLNRLRTATNPVFNNMSFVETTNSLQVTADFSDGGAPITDYNFCISTNADMSAATCQPTTTNSYTFTGLNPGGTYFITVAATNLKGTTTSTPQFIGTPYAAPVLSEPVTATPESDTEISVQGSLTDMGGAPSTTVKVCAYTASDYTDTPICGRDSIITTAPKDYSVTVSGLAQNTHYYLAVIADNGQKKDTVLTDATTLNPGVTVTSVTKTDSTDNALSISAVFTATQTVTGATICAYTDSSCTTTAGTCATDVNIGSSAITGTVTGLSLATPYYVKVTATTAIGSASKVGGPFSTVVPAASITSDEPATIKYCGGTSTITYSANLNGATPTSYEWNVTPSTALHTVGTASTYTVTPQATGTVSVSCKVYYDNDTKYLTANASTTVQSGGTVATIAVVESPSQGTVSVMGQSDAHGTSSSYATSYSWKNSTNETVGTANVPLQISASTPEGTYTVVGANGDGCKVKRQVVLGHVSTNPCTGTAQAGTALGGGLFANKEWTDAEGKIYKVSDHEGNEYGVVKIGNQCWLKENMRCTTSPTGRTDFTYSTTQINATDVCYNYPPYTAFDEASGRTTAFSTSPKGMCPTGWHVPSAEDWYLMESYVATGTANSNPTSSTTYGSSYNLSLKLASGPEWPYNDADYPGDYANPDRNSSGFSVRYQNNPLTNKTSWQSVFVTSTWYGSKSFKYNALGSTSKSCYQTFSTNEKAAVRCVRDN